MKNTRLFPSIPFPLDLSSKKLIHFDMFNVCVCVCVFLFKGELFTDLSTHILYSTFTPSKSIY